MKLYTFTTTSSIGLSQGSPILLPPPILRIRKFCGKAWDTTTFESFNVLCATSLAREIEAIRQDLTGYDVEVPKLDGKWVTKKEEVIKGPSLPYKETFSLLDRLDSTISANRYRIRVSQPSKRALHHVLSFVLYAAWASYFEAESDERRPRRNQEGPCMAEFLEKVAKRYMEKSTEWITNKLIL